MRRLLPLVVSMAVIWSGCGGGKSSTTTTTVSVTISPTTASIAGGGTQQFTATVTGSTNTAVTWAVSGTAGGNAVTGTISATGLYTAPTVLPASTTQTITATSQADTTKIATATVTLTAPSVTISISPATASVPAGGTLQFTPTVTSSDNNTAVTWSVNGCTIVANCGTVSSTGLYTAPLSPPREAITVTATSVSNGAFSASAPITVLFSNASLSGNYVFLVRQPDNASGSGFALRAGTFVAGNGNITGGLEDANSSAGGLLPNTAFTGTYSVGADGRGTATINDTASHSFSFALTSNTRGQLIEIDGGAASGIIRQQNQTTISAVSGPYVFSLSGDNGGPAAAVGQITFAGNTITGDEDMNNAGAVTQGLGLVGSFSVVGQGRGTAVIGSSNYAFYIIDAFSLVLVDIDPAGARLGGTAYAQSTSAFTTASLGTSAYFVSGNAIPGDKPYAQAGRFDTDGVSKLTGGVFDANNAGNLTGNTFSNTAYTLSSAAPTNGRGTISTGTSNFIFWLASPQNNQSGSQPAPIGVIMDAEPNSSTVATGLLFPQQTSISSVSGGFEFVVSGASADGTSTQAIDSQFAAQGLILLNLTGNEDVISAGTMTSQSFSSGSNLTISNTSTERGTGTISGAGYDFYFINADKLIVLSTGSTSVLSGVGERQCSDCQF